MEDVNGSGGGGDCGVRGKKRPERLLKGKEKTQMGVSIHTRVSLAFSMLTVANHHTNARFPVAHSYCYM